MKRAGGMRRGSNAVVVAMAWLAFGSRAFGAGNPPGGSVPPGQTPLGYILHAAGPAANPVRYLGWALTAVCLIVCVVIAAMLAIALWRHRGHVSPAALSSGGGLRFIYVGTGISIVALIGIAIGMLWVLAVVAAPSTPPPLAITVTAYDWWWKVDYGEGQGFTTANEIHIPVHTPVLISLKSADVIHAFWVPQLAGKTQTIPGTVNRQWIEAEKAGTYRGQCTQYCGAQHAHMAFEVVAQPQKDYDAWYAAQQQPAPVPATSEAARGARLFEVRCAGCHAVRGSGAHGVQAPDLTHLVSRRLIAAGTLVNTAANRMDWVQHAQQIKPDTLMPDMKLSSDEARDMAAYLETLR